MLCIIAGCSRLYISAYVCHIYGDKAKTGRALKERFVIQAFSRDSIQNILKV